MAAPIAFEPPSIQKAWQAFLQHIPVVLVSWVGSIVLSLLAVLVYGLTLVVCLLYTSPSPRDDVISRMPSSA